ncbi:MAG: DUF3108 domain-containing protein [Rubrivivax sp.]|nr:DUF3108 domain-containing protein [Rubrivivax sp.]
MLFLHSLLLGLLPRAPGPGWPGEGTRPLQVRQIALPLAAAAAADGAAAPVLAVPAPAQAPRARPAPAATTPATELPPAQRLDPPLNAPLAEPLAEPGGVRVPVYATRLPPAITLHYAMQRGRTSGQAELRWQTDGAHYELTLRGWLGGVPLPASTSVGRLDAQGIAPERQSESRRGRELRAVNFQRDSARITFSGPPLEYPLVPGAQDRLSWMLQIAGVLAADPSLAEAGRQVQLFVAGPRGDAAVWLFEVIGHETLDLPSGPVPGAVHLHREPSRPYDTQVDVWLDPARHHLPVRARLTVRPTGEPTEFVLERTAPP